MNYYTQPQADVDPQLEQEEMDYYDGDATMHYSRPQDARQPISNQSSYQSPGKIRIPTLASQRATRKMAGSKRVAQSNPPQYHRDLGKVGSDPQVFQSVTANPVRAGPSYEGMRREGYPQTQVATGSRTAPVHPAWGTSAPQPGVHHQGLPTPQSFSPFYYKDTDNMAMDVDG